MNTARPEQDWHIEMYLLNEKYVVLIELIRPEKLHFSDV